MNETTKSRRVSMLLGAIVVIGGGAFWVSWVVSVKPYPNQPVHSTIEALGAISAIFMGIIMIQQRWTLGSERDLFFPALGFLAMGVLDGFHAACPPSTPNSSFVFLHSIAGLAGGVGFVLVWRSGWLNRTRWRWWISGAVVGVALLVGGLSLALPELLPPMGDGIKFTPVAIAINRLAGVLFLIGGLHFGRVFFRSGRIEEYLFVLLALLFGAAGLVFEFSRLENYEWWFWHMLRLFAYLVVLLFLFRTNQAAHRMMTESEERFRVLFENAADAFFLSDLNGRFLNVNQAACTGLGYTRAELLALSIADVDVNHDHDKVAAIIAGLAGKEPETLETDHRRKDGDTFPVEVRVRTFGSGQRSWCLSLARDVTERKRARAEKAALERQLWHAQKLESLGVLAGGIAHDFNNLLMTILGNADLALDELPTASPVRSDLREIIKATNRAGELANQMLAYSGKGRVFVTPIDANQLVEDIGQLLAVSISKKTVIKYQLTPNLPPFDGDVTQINQVIMNLITNAAEAIGDASGVITLSTGAMRCDREYLDDINEVLRAGLDEPLAEGLYTYFEVADTGIGMEAEIIEKVFDPFFTTKFTGRGLGMSAVLGIIRGHKGALKIASAVSEGTTFKVLFPTPERPEDTCAVGLEDETETEGDWRGSGTILVAEDEEEVRAVASRMLRRLGFDIVTAADGREALTVFRDRGEEMVCVLLDLAMPRMDGEEAFHLMRRLRPGVKVILCSGYSEQEAQGLFASKSPAGFLQKPYTMAGLKEKLNDVLAPGEA